MLRLLPNPSVQVCVADAYGAGLAGARTPLDRPVAALCMVSSIDGSAAVGGASGGLSSRTDRDVLRALRLLADIIVVGAGTVRDEDYGIPQKPGQRIGVVSRSATMNLDIPLFASGAGFLILPETAPAVPVESVRFGDTRVDLARALANLPGAPKRIQVEGGPGLNAAMLDADLLDEINLTVSPAVVGGPGTRIVAQAAERLTQYRLSQVCTDEEFLFLRYARRP